MKCFIVISLLALSFISFAQNDINEIELKELSSPNSPAFTILGLNPTEVNRPTSAKTMAVSFANTFENNGFISDVAIEATPFWFWPQNNLTFDDYYNTHLGDMSSNKSVLSKLGNNIIQNASISFATSDFNNGIDSIDGRNIAGGLRFQLIPGKPSTSFRQLHSTIKKASKIYTIYLLIENWELSDSTALDQAFRKKTTNKLNGNKELSNKDKEQLKSQIIEVFEKSLLESGINDSSNKEDIMAFINSEKLKYETNINETVSKLKEDANSSRVGLIWEAALGSSLVLPTNQIDYSLGNKLGLWTTLAYRTANHKNDFAVLFRYSGDLQNSYKNSTDVGFGYILNRKNYNITLESILRWYKTETELVLADGTLYSAKECNRTYRIATSLQYKLTDYINFNISLGINYNDNSVNHGEVFSLVNLNIAIPEKQTLKVN